VPRKRLSFLASAAVAVLLVFVVAGCGGIDKGKLESAIKSQTNDQYKASGSNITVSDVSCAKTSDAYHFTCTLTKEDGSTVLTVKATCTHGGTCRWTRE
jgi:hypothetical protein